MSKFLLVWVVVIGIALSSCSLSVNKETSTLVMVTNSGISPMPLTETQPPLPTFTATYVPSNTPEPSATPFTPFTASVWADNVNVRTNPGYLFPSLKLLAKGTKFIVLGKAPGGEWIYSQLQDGKIGWIFFQLIESGVDLQQLPIIEPVEVQLIKGTVRDSTGIPIQGIGFTVLQEIGGKSISNTVLTDFNGEFYSFMPLSSAGEWIVTFNAIACKSNVWVDNSCAEFKQPYKGLVEPQTAVATLPQPAVMEFLWK